MDPTRIDAGRTKEDLTIEIIINPANKSISIKENVNDPILFQYLMGQALQTYSQRQMKIRAEMSRSRITVPQ